MPITFDFGRAGPGRALSRRRATSNKAHADTAVDVTVVCQAFSDEFRLLSGLLVLARQKTLTGGYRSFRPPSAPAWGEGE